ncbi:MAG: isoprenyl transferase [Lachnospiraceae bacterium]|nr:isoprenyl transferase [Lachnospiraceae bacterium]
MNIPKHIAIILDGNGRWAKAKGMPRTYGHSKGSENVEKMCDVMESIGVKYFTVYAFSTENWKRPADEVNVLMDLLGKYMKKLKKRAANTNSRVRVIGDTSVLDGKLQEIIRDTVESSKDNTGLQFQIAINYGGRDELRRAFTRIAGDVKEGIISPEDITEDTISKALDTGDIPDPDLLIRTSGEQRLSNFLPWQLAYTEFYFTQKHWPEFDKDELMKAIENYNKRDRRYGQIKEE